MKNRKICKSGMVMILLVLVFLLIPVTSTTVKAGTKNYFSNLNGSKSFGYYGSIYKIKVKNDRIVVYGSFSTFSTKQSLDQAKKLKYKKRTYKFAKKVKFYTSGGDQPDMKISKSQFKQLVESMNGLDLQLQVKNGKIVKAIVCS